MNLAAVLWSDENLSTLLSSINCKKKRRCLLCSCGNLSAAGLEVHQQSAGHKDALEKFRSLLIMCATLQSGPLETVPALQSGPLATALQGGVGRPDDEKRIGAFMLSLEKRKLLTSMSFDKSVAALRSRAWIGEMHTLAYKYLSSKDSNVLGPHFDMVRALNKYELYENMTILKLAIWKAECLMKVPDNCTDYLTFLNWSSTGWKSRKEEVFRSSLFLSVITLVKPFVGI